MRKILTRDLFSKILRKIDYFYKNLENIDIEKIDIKKDEKILIISPHPDDESIGCSGVMLTYPDNVKVVCVTDGRYGDSSIEPQEMVSIREQEFKAAMEMAKVSNYQFLSVEDGKVKENFKIFESIDFNGYKHIFIPNYLDRHFDHKAISHHIYTLIKHGKISTDTLIYYYEVWNSVPVVNSFIDLSSLVDRKRDIISNYSSQLKHIDYTEKIIGLNRFRGLALELEVAECYMRLTVYEFLKFMDFK